MTEPLLVTHNLLPRLWPEIEQVISGAVEKFDEYTIDDLKAMLLRGSHHAWIWAPDGDIEAAMICTPRQYPRKRSYLIQLVAGTGMQDWLKYQPLIESFATALGCTEIETIGRKGWAKVPGFKLTEYVCRKEIGEST